MREKASNILFDYILLIYFKITTSKEKSLLKLIYNCFCFLPLKWFVADMGKPM